MGEGQGASSISLSQEDEGLRLAGRIEGDTHILPVRVYYEDTDFSGVVYHANYLRFLERGRTDFLRLAGVDQSTLHAGGDGLISGRAAHDPRFPDARPHGRRARGRDPRCRGPRGASLLLAQRILRRTRSW